LKDESKLMSKDLSKTMTTPVDAGYGLGWGIRKVGASGYFSHGGWDAYEAHEILPVPSRMLKEYTGRYHYNAAIPVVVTSKQGKLFLNYPSAKATELVYTGRGFYIDPALQSDIPVLKEPAAQGSKNGAGSN